MQLPTLLTLLLRDEHPRFVVGVEEEEEVSKRMFSKLMSRWHTPKMIVSEEANEWVGLCCTAARWYTTGGETEHGAVVSLAFGGMVYWGGMGTDRRLFAIIRRSSTRKSGIENLVLGHDSSVSSEGRERPCAPE